MPRLVREVIDVMAGKDDLSVTATELMNLLDPCAPPEGRPYRVVGMPRTPARLSKVLMQPRVAASLEAHGIKSVRGWSGHQRIIRIVRVPAPLSVALLPTV